MMDAIKGEEKNHINRATFAAELAKLPATAESKAAFKEAYESIPLSLTGPSGANALQQLTETAGTFFDSDLVPWLLDRAKNTKGSGEEKKALQGVILLTAMKLARTDQMDDIRAAVKTYGTKLEKDNLILVEKIVKACGDRTQCYLGAIEKSENQERKTQFGGIKAGYMIAIYGDEKARDDLVGRLDGIENAAVRYVASRVIDHLSPKGSDDVADKLEKIIAKNKKSGDKNRIQGDSPLKEVMYRLQSRKN